MTTESHPKIASHEDLEIVVSSAAGYAGAGDAGLAKAKAAFDSLANTLRDSVLPIREALALAENAPDELELRLELAFKGETKWVVVSAAGQATVSIKLVWKRKL